MKTIAIVSSPLQLAGFNASSVPKEKRFIIGNRGTQGDVSYDQSVLNDANFITDLEKRIAKEEVEIYLPNSLNLIYFYALSSPHIKRISFVDEGRLTKRFLQGGYAKPRAKHHDMMAFLMRMARFVPAPLRTFPYKLIAYSLRRWVVQSYEQDTLAYPYRTIERSEKSGTLLSHIEGNVPLDWVEQVDLTKGLEFPKNYQDRACLFIHPRHVHKTQWLEKLRDAFAPEEGALLVRPHPNFSRARSLFTQTISRLESADITCELAELSGTQDVAIELHARGVNTFFCGETTITDTVEAYPTFFDTLRVVKIE